MFGYLKNMITSSIKKATKFIRKNPVTVAICATLSVTAQMTFYVGAAFVYKVVTGAVVVL